MADRYRVNAPSAVLGNEPGAEFEAKLDPVLKKRLVDSGALTALTTPPPTPKPVAPASTAPKETK